jgi:hypothetical protein
VGRGGGLTGDPLRLAGPASAGLAMRELQRATSHTWPLRAAGDSVASLTCGRLEALLRPPRGDDALAAALDRVGDGVVEEVAAPRPGASHTIAGRRAAPAPPAAGSRDLRPPPGEFARSFPLRERVRPEVASHRRVRSVGSPHDEASAARPTDGVRSSPRDVSGLEWLVRDVTVLQEAAAAQIELAAPVARVGSADVTTAPTSRRDSVPNDQPAGVWSVPSPAPARFGHAPPRDHLSPSRAVKAGAPPPVAPITRSAAPAVGGKSALESLVRAWRVEDAAEPDVAQPTVSDTTTADTQASVVDDVPSGGTGPRAARAPDVRAKPSRDDELLGLRDEVGRMLVAELRRYGIEVGT